jgi:type II secretory ATPase GspE/PulE/Tfp pilus assembly ATPase PilB-like protein
LGECVSGGQYSIISYGVHQPIPQSTSLLVDYLFSVAILKGASDIHIEWYEYDVGVRLRIDGVLRDGVSLARWQALQVLSRLKVLMGLDITQQHRPQDGAVRIVHEGQSIDIRASFFPTLYGEKVVLRLLGSHYDTMQLHALPFSGKILAALYAVAREAQGLFLVTGPTGAGKTTTLYAVLQAVDRARKNVITLENPIEYRIQHVTQTQIDESKSLCFATAIRSILRQDPDVVLIGELRDTDTLKSAIEAALTGHLVVSTLHTGRASAVPIRLREMGIEPYLIASALKGVLAQRLLSTLCGHCQISLPVSEVEAAWVRLHGSTLTHTGSAAGCASCQFTGYEGQIVIGELWQCDSAAIELLYNEASTQQDFQQCAEANGMNSLAKQGLELVRAGRVALADLMCHDM